jgi:hypothetical protein
MSDEARHPISDRRGPTVSRHSFSAGSRIAAAWLKEGFEATGATCELEEFLVGFSPNVIWYQCRPINIPHFISFSSQPLPVNG